VILLISAYSLAQITGMSHQHPARNEILIREITGMELPSELKFMKLRCTAGLPVISLSNKCLKAVHLK
jgi:hypothetical protein